MDELTKQLRDLLASQGELVGSITHDLKGLLGGVEGGVYLVNSGITKGNRARVKEGVAMMQRNLGRIRRAVSGVLYYIKDRDKDWQSIDVEELCSAVHEALAESAEHLGVAFRAEPTPGKFDADRLAVHSLIVNILEYVLEACSLAKLKSAASVSLVARLDAEQVVFEIVADGFVIDDEARDYVLGQYYAPRGIDRRHLSAFISHKLVRSHGGTLEIFASPDEETTRFIIRLPAKKPADTHNAEDNSEQERLAAEWDRD